MSDSKLVTAVTALMKKKEGKSSRISSNFALNHLDRALGWPGSTKIALRWESAPFAAFELRIKNDKAAAIDTDWKEHTKAGQVFYTGSIDDLDKKTKLYFATQGAPGNDNEVQGEIRVLADKAS